MAPRHVEGEGADDVSTIRWKAILSSEVGWMGGWMSHGVRKCLAVRASQHWSMGVNGTTTALAIPRTELHHNFLAHRTRGRTVQPAASASISACVRIKKIPSMAPGAVSAGRQSPPSRATPGDSRPSSSTGASSKRMVPCTAGTIADGGGWATCCLTAARCGSGARCVRADTTKPNTLDCKREEATGLRTVQHR